MATGPHSDSDQPLSEINVTPLVDVMLVLLVIFILLAPVMVQALRVDLPKVAAPPSQEPVVAEIVLDGEGVSLDGSVVTLEAMTVELRERLAAAPALVVRIHAGSAIHYGEVAAVMGAVRGSGVQRLAFATSPAELER